MSSDISGKSFSEEKKIVVNKWCDFHEFEIFFFFNAFDIRFNGRGCLVVFFKNNNNNLKNIEAQCKTKSQKRGR